MAFDINGRDVTGQNLIYLATCVSSAKIVDLLLAYKVKARKATQSPKRPSPGGSKATGGLLASSPSKLGLSRDDTGQFSLRPPMSQQPPPPAKTGGIQVRLE